eukprot:TRINITY_DN37733_c0_g1_i1.p1 TRINITY_DN37733_c0_g1~~TRINITY_DN37733_c0_g1_i1.p1  ORF type:complete len:290 (+),score=62.25 TRINITY_DN37733_c0_g1_i1:42-872(+)
MEDIFAAFKNKPKGSTKKQPAKKESKLPEKKVKNSASEKAPTAADTFFDLRGEQKDSEITKLLEAEDTKPKKYMAIANLQPGIAEIYGEVLRNRLEGLQIKNIETDWMAHVIRIKFGTPHDAIAASTMLDRQKVFATKIRAGLTSSRDGEILIRNLLGHVTEEIITQFVSSFGTVLSTKVLSHHAVYKKAYVTFSDSSHALKCCQKLHGARNTFQDLPIFVSMTSNNDNSKQKPVKQKRKKSEKEDSGRKEPKVDASEDEEDEEQPYVYDHNKELM